MNSNSEVKSLGFDAESFVPESRQAFRVDEIAEMLSISVKHAFDLIIEGCIAVNRERIDSAPGRSSILVARQSLIHFVQRRRNSKERLEAKAALARVRNGKQSKGGPR